MTRRLKHLRTDPSCRQHTERDLGRDVMIWPGWWVRSPRRWWFDRQRGKSCPNCTARRKRQLAKWEDRALAELQQALARFDRRGTL